jgi:DNA-binding IclR family transcriptional regulator
MKKSEEKYIVPAVDQATAILFCMANTTASHLSLMEIYTAVGIHKSKAYSILQTLQKAGLVQRNIAGKGYSLGPGLITLSRKVLDNFNLPRIAEPILEELAKKTDATVTLGLIAEDKVFVVSKHEGKSDVGITIRIGHQFPLTYGSHGKAIAAFLPEKELDHILQNNHVYFHGSPKKLDIIRLKKELEQCRRNGFAMDLGEIKPGLNSVAAPVLGPGGGPIGYITLIGLFPAETIKKFGPLIAEAGKTLSQKFGINIE